MKQNITLSLDAGTLQRARELAARQNVSVSRFLAADLAEQVDSDLRYQQAKRQAIGWLQDSALELGGRYLSRDDAHAR
ncbi:MAG: hypothetical protein J5X22_22345 [Candidatus Accumulibacter sp.]|uniref:CopG family transcriptional regulator n=2 Tax=Candidatus Accumulibacter TaxID=327159 RepID=A0A080MC77_9PROT|nr:MULTISPECIES: hypothetical protein [Candidatus Accumulibacter]KFB74764.1 MAG: hypothetical protein AW06_004289 [Candidatus Accumulibacter cognatus]MBL8400920.1 hypothetical protein [Accumulibacter sp.]MBO3713115.1 hypothetical protein [Accumulibacter sp.]TMQ77136.1 hypothetical protein ACCUM_3469 [Candidatus Accumulibacter phosphatis]